MILIYKEYCTACNSLVLKMNAHLDKETNIHSGYHTEEVYSVPFNFTNLIAHLT